MRTALIAVNLAIAGASAGLFGYTFFAREHLVALAREYVVAKTVRFAAPAVEEVERGLRHPATAALVPAAVRAAAQAEIDAFRNDSGKYVRDLAARGAAVEKPKHALADKILGWKESIRDYFDETMTGLVRDVRIFSGTNVVAGLLAAWLATRARGRWRHRLTALALFLPLALAFNIYLFIDGMTFFRILFDARVGWSYPVLVAITFGYLFLKFGRHVPLAPEPRPVGRAGSEPAT